MCIEQGQNFYLFLTLQNSSFPYKFQNCLKAELISCCYPFIYTLKQNGIDVETSQFVT